MATHLDAQAKAFRERPLDAGPYTCVAMDALTMKVWEKGRIVNVHALIATGVNNNGHREVLGLDVASQEDGAGWLTFLRGLVARGLAGVSLVTSDAHTGLTAAAPHYLHNLLTDVPRPPSQEWPALVRTIFDQADAQTVREQFGKVADTRPAATGSKGCRHVGV